MQRIMVGCVGEGEELSYVRGGTAKVFVFYLDKAGGLQETR